MLLMSIIVVKYEINAKQQKAAISLNFGENERFRMADIWRTHGRYMADTHLSADMLRTCAC